MGVKNLWKVASVSSKKINDINDLKGMSVAIDTSLWNYISGSEESSTVKLYFIRICQMLDLGLRPVLVFEGKVMAQKKDEIQQRNIKRFMAEVSAAAHMPKVKDKLIDNLLVPGFEEVLNAEFSDVSENSEDNTNPLKRAIIRGQKRMDSKKNRSVAGNTFDTFDQEITLKIEGKDDQVKHEVVDHIPLPKTPEESENDLLNELIGDSSISLSPSVSPTIKTLPQDSKDPLIRVDNINDESMAPLINYKDLSEPSPVRISVDSVSRARYGRVNTQLEKLANMFGIPVVWAPYEAEITCWDLCNRNIVDAVASEDSDLILMNTPLVIRGLFSKSSPMISYTPSTMRLTTIQMVAYAILCGCDFTPGVKGIGPVFALSVIREFFYGSTGEEMLKSLQNFKNWCNNCLICKDKRWNDCKNVLMQNGFPSLEFCKSYRIKAASCIFPLDFPDPKVLQLFITPRVSSDTHIREICPRPKWDQIRDFITVFGKMDQFSVNREIKYLAPKIDQHIHFFEKTGLVARKFNKASIQAVETGQFLIDQFFTKKESKQENPMHFANTPKGIKDYFKGRISDLEASDEEEASQV